VPGPAGDLKRLITFLLAQAAAAGATAVAVRTGPAGEKVRLRVEDNGPAVAPEELPRLFDPSAVTRPGVGGLGLAACKGIVRRLGGKIQGESRPGGGVAVVVELTPRRP
jgi:signal transduction histidine kinase